MKTLLDLFLPRHCVLCDKRLNNNESAICTACLVEIFHPTITDVTDNEVVRRLWGDEPVLAGITLFYYKKGTSAHLLLDAMKYKGRVDVCIQMGQMLASTYASTDFFQSVDAIIPVPLSKKRRHWRGYNQAEKISLGIHKVTGIPVLTNALTRPIDNETQTRLSSLERKENVQDIFHATDSVSLGHKHLLIVDDVITTGATLQSAITTLSKRHPTATFSIASVALTAE